jgi:hypothetical protein
MALLPAATSAKKIASGFKVPISFSNWCKDMKKTAEKTVIIYFVCQMDGTNMDQIIHS